MMSRGCNTHRGFGVIWDMKKPLIRAIIGRVILIAILGVSASK